MPTHDHRAARRFGRDRDLLPAAAPRGPYETAYDVRRGYEQPSRRPAGRAAREADAPPYLGRVGEQDRA